MSITVTITNPTTGLNEVNTWAWDDPTMSRFLVWAKQVYFTLNADGTINPPSNAQACRRAAKAWVSAMSDSIRKAEGDSSIAALPPPVAIVVAP